MKKPTYDELVDALSIADHKQLRMKYAQLKQRSNELEAQVEQLRSGLNQAIELLVTALIEPEQITDAEISELRDIEQATPAQCLAEIKAQAGVYGLKHGVKLATGTEVNPDSVVVELWCEGYAEQLRQQVNHVADKNL